MAMVERNKIEWRKTQVVQSNGQLVQIHGKSNDKQIDQRGIGRERAPYTQKYKLNAQRRSRKENR